MLIGHQGLRYEKRLNVVISAAPTCSSMNRPSSPTSRHLVSKFTEFDENFKLIPISVLIFAAVAASKPIPAELARRDDVGRWDVRQSNSSALTHS